MRETWPEVSLGEHVDLLTGYPFKSKHFTDNPDDIHLVKGATVQQGYLAWEGARRWPRDEYEDFEKYQLQPGDVILAMDRPWVQAGLKCAWITSKDPDALLVQRVARLRGKEGLHTGYLRYMIASQSFSDYIKPIVTGVNVPHISADQIGGFRFQLPPRDVQRAVVGLLRPFDDLIENNLRRIEILEEMAQAVYREWFVNFRFPGHENVVLTDSKIGSIPSSWQVLPFGHLAKIVRDNIQPAKFPDELFDHFSFAAHDADRLPSVEAGESIKSGKLLVTAPSVLLAKLNPRIPRVWLAKPASERRSIASSEFLVLRSRKDVPLEFVYAICANPDFQARLAAYAGGTSTSHQRLKQKDLLQELHAVPHESLLAAFQERVQPMFGLAANLISQNANLSKTRGLLLPKLVSGEIGVSDLNVDTEWLAA